jgi:septal ring factor EnvC (AmiA/AmiB activator)
MIVALATRRRVAVDPERARAVSIYATNQFGKECGMAESGENLVLEQLRALRTDIASVKDDTREIKTRLAVLESGVASLRRDSGDFATSIAAQHLNYDRLSERIERIERRLDLADAS